MIQPPTRKKLPTSLEQKYSYGDLQEYTDNCFPSASRMQLLGVYKCCSVNSFSDTNQKHVCWKIHKVSFLVVLQENIFTMLNEIRLVKWVSSWVKLYPLDTGRKLKVHKTFRRHPGRLLNVLCTFSLRPMSRGVL